MFLSFQQLNDIVDPKPLGYWTSNVCPRGAISTRCAARIVRRVPAPSLRRRNEERRGCAAQGSPRDATLELGKSAPITCTRPELPIPLPRSSNANRLWGRVSAEPTTVITDISNTWLVPGYLRSTP